MKSTLRTTLMISLAILSMLCESSCRKFESSGLRIAPPTTATLLSSVMANDGETLEMQFVVSATENSEVAANHIQSQLEENGFRRCDSKSDKWITFRSRHADSSAREVTRLVRYFQFERDHARIATIFAEQSCSSVSSKECTQRFVLNVSRAPDELPGRDQIIEELCA